MNSHFFKENPRDLFGREQLNPLSPCEKFKRASLWDCGTWSNPGELRRLTAVEV